jgi:G6PDH family F420-dependent oxidoreductase
MRLGYGCSAEELAPREIVRLAHRAEQCGFETAWVSDHFHPWIDAQGESPFVWCVLGGIASTTEHLRVGTGVTCPIVRMHPALVAHAAATAAAMLGPGRSFLGVGTGEHLNEHVLGDRWPPPDLRLAMLEEAITIIRALWTGEEVTHRGEHFTVEDARLYTLPGASPPIMVSAFGPRALALAARAGDGLVGTSPDVDAVRRFEAAGGAGKPKLAQLKVAWAPSAEEGRRLAHARWPTSALRGSLLQELATPRLFEAAVTNVTEEQVAKEFVLGPDPEAYLAALADYDRAGFDEVYLTQVGTDQDAFLDFCARELLPAYASDRDATAPATGPRHPVAQDAETITEVVDELQANGFDGQLRVHEGGRLECLACHTTSDAHDLTVHAVRRLEGASDPADMLLVAAVECPACHRRGTVILGYGPEATIEDAEALLAIDTERAPAR